MKTKYVCPGPVSPHANFLVNRLVGTVTLLVKNAGGGRKKSQTSKCNTMDLKLTAALFQFPTLLVK